MATKSAQQRNLQALSFVFGMDTLLIRTSGGSTTLSTHTGIAWGIPASGASAMSATVTDASADATGTAAEAILQHTNGTGTSYLVNDASTSIGDTTLAFDGGSGTFEAGDIITLAGDTQEYLVLADHAGTSGTLSIFPPLVAAPADNAAITIGTARSVSGLTVGTGSEDIVLDSTSITSGQSVDITAFTFTEPAATA